MSAEVLTVAIEPPEVEEIPRTIEVACGDSFVTVKQMDGRRGRKWTVYSNDGHGMSGPVMQAPTGESPDDVLSWAHAFVYHKERERLAYAELGRKLSDVISATNPG